MDRTNQDDTGLIRERDPVPELIDMVPEVHRVRQRRSPWAAFVLATFTGLTGLGLASAAMPRTIVDRAAERGSAPHDGAGDALVATSGTSQMDGAPGLPGAAAARRATATLNGQPVVSTVRLLANPSGDVSGRVRLVVSGAADPSVARIEVTALLGERTVSTALVMVGAPTADGVSAGHHENASVPWSTVLDFTVSGPLADAIATVRVSWVMTRDTSGSLPLVVPLDDGRGTRG